MKKITFILLFLGIASVFGQIPQNGLVAYYPFNGNAIDASGNGNNGIVNSATLCADILGNPKSAYNLYGGSTINFSNPFLGGIQNSAFTFHVQIKLNELDIAAVIWQKTYFWGEVAFFIDNKGTIIFRWANTVTGNKYSTIYSQANAVQTGTWYDIVVVFQNSSGQIYLNGYTKATNLLWKTQGGSILSTTTIEASCNFAQNANSSIIGSGFNGIIDEFAIWNRALTQNEISALCGKAFCSPTPIANNITIKSGETASLNATGGTNYKWYDKATGGTVLATTATYFTLNLIQTDTFYVSNTDTCESARVPVIVYVNNVNILYPIINERLCVGIIVPIHWSLNDSILKIYNPSSLVIDYSTDGGISWKNISTVNGKTKTYLWTVPNDISTNCIIRINDVYNPNKVYGISQKYRIENIAVKMTNITFYTNVNPAVDNPSNLLQVGKRFRFKIQAVNNYTQNLLTLKGVIKSLSPDVIVTDSLGTYNNILTGNSAWSVDEYEILVPNNFPADGGAIFKFTMKDQIVNTATWATTFFIPFIESPKYILADDDAFYESNGNGNGVIEKGETVEMVPVLNNKSWCDFSNITILYKPADANSTIKDDTQTFSSMTAISTIDYYSIYDMVLTNKSSTPSFALNEQLSGTYNSNILIKYGYLINFPNGTPPSVEKKLIPASGSINYQRMEFYQNLSPNPTNPLNLIGPGKKVRFKLNVQNRLNIRTYALKGIIKCSDPTLIITDSTAAYDEVGANASIWSLDEYEVLIPSQLPANGEYNFTLKMQDPFIQNGTWISSFKIPLLKLSQTFIDDDANPDSKGNGNGIIEPGETIEILPLLKNMTSSTFYTPSGTLSSNTTKINIWNNKQGSTGLVYNTWRYNVFSNVSVPITPNSDNVMPEQDFVFDYNETGIYSFILNLGVITYLNSAQGGSWDIGGIKMNYSLPIVLNQSYPTGSLQITASGPTSFCDGSSVNLIISSGSATGYKYQWKKDNNNIVGATNTIYTANQGGIYKVLVTDNESSVSTSNEISITVNFLPLSTITALSSTNFCQVGSVILNASTGSNYIYKWFKDGVFLSGQTGYSYTATISGQYSALISNPLGCSVTSNTIVVNSNTCGYKISGNINYDNISNTILGDVNLAIKNQVNELIDTTKSDINGYYEFNDIPNGTYSIIVSSNKDVRQINPLDALLVNRNFINVFIFPDKLTTKAADVNIDNKVNPTDALLINRFYIQTITSFKSGKWLFETPFVNVNSSNVNQNIKGICYGDVNASY